mgnify:FL=1
MVSNFNREWLGKQRRQPEDERKKMQEAFERAHNSKEWGMICMIHEVDGFLDIVIRDEQKPGLRCLCGVCWNKTYLTPEQLAWIQEKLCELKRKNSENPSSSSKTSCPDKRTYNWGCIDSRSCWDGEISASSPEEAERVLRQKYGCEGTITVFYG